MSFAAKPNQPASLVPRHRHRDDLWAPSRQAALVVGADQLLGLQQQTVAPPTIPIEKQQALWLLKQPEKAESAAEPRRDWKSQAAPRTTPKKQRRPSHIIKQEAKRQLRDQIRHLECQEALLRQEKGIVDPKVNAGALECNAKLHDAVLRQRLILANTQSAFSAFTTSQVTSPLESYIHLGEDWDQRRQALLGMKDAKLDVAQRFLAERTRHLSPCKKFYEVSQFESPDGDICIVKTDVTPFEGATSVRQVYDALQSYFMSSDATIVELPGSISVRKDDGESAKSIVLHHRLVTFEQSGILSEKNTVLFLDQSGLDAANTEEQCALFTGDFVDRDDLYPYCPSQRLRKDATSVIKLSAHWHRVSSDTQVQEGPDPKPLDETDSEFVVVLTRWVHLRVHRPEIPVSSRILQCVADDLLKGVDKMIHVTRAQVDGETSKGA